MIEVEYVGQNNTIQLIKIIATSWRFIVRYIFVNTLLFLD